MVNGLFGSIVAPFCGNVNLEEGITDCGGITPIGAGLQVLPLIC